MKSRPDRKEIGAVLQASLAAGIRPVLATVLRATGSAPLPAGARAVISPDGALLAGTIGGGLLEREAQHRALTVALSGTPEIFEFHLRGPGGTDAYPICGGAVRTLLQLVTDSDASAHADALRAAADRQSGTLTTAIVHNDGAVRTHTTWTAHSAIPIPGVGDGDEAAGDGDGGPDASGTRCEWFHEPVSPSPRLLIVGAGHVGQALAAQARLAGFDLAVIDDRPELLDAESLPPGTRIHCGPIADSVAAFASDAATFIALVNRGHRADAEALAVCIRKPCAYLGMIGSRRKARLMRAHFIAQQIATAEEFDRIHTPIGLDIGAETAPEIAAAIVAQLIHVKNRLRGQAQHGMPSPSP